METTFGFVVIGRNEGARLLKCLDALQSYGQTVVYADSASTDGSPETAKRVGATVVRLDPSRPLNASRGRKEGYDALKLAQPDCRFVQFIDGDCLLSAGWIDQALAFMATHPHAAVVCGRRYEAHPHSSLYNLLCDEEWNTPLGRVAASGGDAFMRATALDSVGGFDPTLMASEEPELAARLRAHGWDLWRMDTLMTQHDAAIFTFQSYWRRSIRAGYGYAQAWMRTRNLKEPINERLLLSACLWTLIIPGIIITFAAAEQTPITLLALPAIYFLQISRIAFRRGPAVLQNWRYAAVIMAIKVAEAVGAAKAFLSDGKRSAIEYKGR